MLLLVVIVRVCVLPWLERVVALIVETLRLPLELTPFTPASRRLSIIVALLVVAVPVRAVELDTDRLV